MPLYTFRNKKTGEEWEDMMTIAEMEAFSKKRDIELVPTGFGIVSSVGQLDSNCLLYTSPSPRDGRISRMPSSA